MKIAHRFARINFRLLAALLVLTVLICAAAFAVHRRQERMSTARVLAAAKVALSDEDWPEACRNLRMYLSKYPGDEDLLSEFAAANLAIRPAARENLITAVDAYRRLLRLRPDDERILEQLTKLYFRLADFNEAAYICRQWLEVHPYGAEPMLWSARVLRAQGKFDEVKVLLRSLVEAHPRQIEAYLMLGRLAAEQDSITVNETSLTWLDRGIEANPRSAAARAERARFYRIIQQDNSLALAELESADSLNPEDPIVLLQLAEEWLAWRHPDRAEAELKAIQQTSEAAFDRFVLDPDSFAAGRFLVEGRLALMKGDRQHGVLLADRALEELVGGGRLNCLPLAASLYLADGRIDAAQVVADEFQTAADKLRRNSPILASKAAILAAMVSTAGGSYYRAINLLEPVVEQDTGNPQALKLLGEAYGETGQHRRAAAAWERFLAMSPNDLATLIRLARVNRNRDWQKVAEYADRALRLDPDHLEGRLLSIEARINIASINPDAPGRFQDISKDLIDIQETRPEIRQAYTLAAQIAAAEGRSEDAIAELDKAISRTDEKSSAAIQLAEYYRALDRIEEARSTAHRAIRLDPDSLAPRLLLVRLQSADGDEVAARKTLETAIKECSAADRVSAQHALARFMLTRDDRSEGLAMLRRLASQNNEHLVLVVELLSQPEVQTDLAECQELVDRLKLIEGDRGLHWRFHQARLWLRGGEWRKRSREIDDLLRGCVAADPHAVSAYLELMGLDRALGEMDTLNYHVSQALRANPDNPLILLAKAEMLRTEGRLTEAQRLAESVLGERPLMVQALNLLSQLELDAGDPKAALDYNERALKAAPADTAVIVLRALILERSGDHASAIRDLKAFLRRHSGPETLAVHTLLGNLFLGNGNLASARQQLRAAQSLDPDHKRVQLLHMRLLFEEQDFDRLVALLERIRARHPGETSLLFVGAGMLAAASQPGILREARSLLEHAVTTDPTSVEGYFSLGQLAYQMGDVDTAEGSFRRLIDLMPSHTQALNNLAWILSEERQDHTSALALANEALRYDPENIHVLDTRGVVLTRMDRLEEARNDFERTIELAQTVPAIRALAYLHLGRNWIEQGNPGEASTCLGAAKQIDDEHKVLAASKRAMLEELIRAVAN